MANEFDPRTIAGLSSAEVAEKLDFVGYNELPTAKRLHPLRRQEQS